MIIGMVVVIGPGLSSDRSVSLLWLPVGTAIIITGLLIGGLGWWRRRSRSEKPSEKDYNE